MGKTIKDLGKEEIGNFPALQSFVKLAATESDEMKHAKVVFTSVVEPDS